MTAPKLLPWYANKAGVSIERATALWHEAIREATAVTGWVGSPEYWGVAMDTLVRLLDEEKRQTCTPRVTPLIRSQNTLWRLPLIALEDVVTAVALRQRNGGGRFSAPWRRAA